MSVLDKEISSSGRDCGNDDGEEEEDAENGRCRCKARDGKKSSGIGFSRNFGKAKQVVLSPFTKSKKQFPRRNRAAAAASCSPFSSGTKFGVSGGNTGCYLCFMPSLTVDTSAESPSSDPNSPNFTYGKLRSLLEKNDFYARECNPHLDFDAKSPW